MEDRPEERRRPELQPCFLVDPPRARAVVQRPRRVNRSSVNVPVHIRGASTVPDKRDSA